MKKFSLLAILLSAALLTGCKDVQTTEQLVTCQQEKQEVQSQLELANLSVQQKDEQIDKLKVEVREVNQKALESIRTMMERQNAKDIELKNKLKEAQDQAQALQGQVAGKDTQIQTLQTQVNELKAKADQADALQKQVNELKEKAAQVETLQQKINELQAQQAEPAAETATE